MFNAKYFITMSYIRSQKICTRFIGQVVNTRKHQTIINTNYIYQHTIH